MAALLSVVTLLWAAYWMIRLPEPGFSGPEVAPIYRDITRGPAAGKLFQGDRILAVNGMSIEQAYNVLATLTVGESLHLRVQDPAGLLRDETVILAAPIAPDTLFDRFSLLAVAAVFWLAAVAISALLRPWASDDRAGLLLVAFLHLIVVFLSASVVSVYLHQPAIAFSWISAAWLGIVTIQLHTQFPVMLSRKIPALVWQVGYGLAGLLTVCIAVVSIVDFSWVTVNQDPLGLIEVVWLVACLAILLVLLMAGGLAQTTDEQRFQRRIIAIAGAAGFTPLLALSLVPLLVPPSAALVAPTITVLPLVLIPLGYAYAILRYRLIQYDVTVSRAIGYLISMLILAVLLISVVFGLTAVGLAPTGPGFLITLVILATALAIVFEPVRRRIQDSVDGIFDRQYDEFRSTLRGVDQALSASPDVASWAQALCVQFSTALDVRPVGLLYRAPEGKVLRLAAHDPTGLAGALPREVESLSPVIAQIAEWAEPCNTADLRAAVDRPGLSAVERVWLTNVVFDLWWPITAHGVLQAVLVLGRKPTTYAAEEVELIALASRQIGAALENAQFARELEQLSRAALQTRDDERKRISRELHDHIIQPLVGLNFSLAAARDVPEAAEARNQIANLIHHVRRISADLRPAALDEVGLAAAASGLARTFARNHKVVCDLAVRPDEDISVPEPLASTFFSALREALNNIAQHAEATRVSVLLEVQANALTLVVHDDGLGFAPPARLGQLAPSGHFGLLGLQERLAAVGGTLAIHSEPGQGTRLECRAPLPRA